MLRKNVAGQFVYFQLISTTDGSNVTGATVSVRRCLDGTFAAGGGTVTEDTAGYYKYAASQGDTNGNNISFRFSATGAITVEKTIITTAADPTDAVRFGLTALPNANAEAAGGLYTRGSGAGQINQPANGQIDANTVKVGGTTQTAYDIGANLGALNTAASSGDPGTTTTLIAYLKQIINTLEGTAGIPTYPAAAVAANAVSLAEVIRSIDSRLPAALGANGNVKADVRDFNGVAGTFASGRPEVNTTHFGGSALTQASGRPEVNATHWNGTAVATPNTAGVPVVDTRRLIRQNTAQGTGNSTTAIKLDAGASATTDFYKGKYIQVISGTGAPEGGICTAYDGTTKIATIAPAWPTAPDNTSVFQIFPAEVDVEVWRAVQPNALVSGRTDSSVGAMAADVVTAAAIATDAIGANEFAQGAADKVWSSSSRTLSAFGFTVTVSTNNDKTGYTLSSAGVQAIWDALSTALTTAGSIGKRLVDFITGDTYGRLGAPAGASVSADIAAVKSDTGAVKASQIIQTGTASAGGAATITIQTALGADSLPVGCLLAITGGTGVGQCRVISGYVNATKVVTVGHNWTTQPDNTSVYYIINADTAKVDSNLKVAGVVLTDTLTTYTGNTPQTGDCYPKVDTEIATIISTLGTPVGASVSADLAAVQADTDDIQSRLPAALVGGRIDASVGAMGANTITATAIATDAIDADALKADAVAEIADGVWDEAQAGHTTAGTFGKYLDAQVSTVGGGTAADIADAVWDEAIAGHLGAGSTGEALNAAGAAGDPWITALPGAYGAGSAGKIVGDYLDAAVSSRAEATSLSDLSAYVGGGLAGDVANQTWQTHLPGSYTAGQAGKQLSELYQIEGLDAANPMTVTPDSRTAGTIDLEITGDGETTTTVTRQ